MGSGGPRGLQILRSGVSVRGGFDSHAFPPFIGLALVGLLTLATGAGAADGGASAAADSLASARAPGVAAPADSLSPPASDSLPASPPAPARATAADSIALPADPDTLPFGAPAARRILPPPGRFDQPRWVMLRSLLVPGWGQAHNGAWVKAALVAAGDGALRVRFFRDERRLSDLNGAASGRLGELESAEGTLAAAQAELVAAQASGDTARIAAAEAAVLAANARRAGASDAYNQAVLAYNALLDTSINRRWLLGGVVLYALIDAYVDAHFKRFDIHFEFDPALPGGGGAPGGRLQIRWAF